MAVPAWVLFLTPTDKICRLRYRCPVVFPEWALSLAPTDKISRLRHRCHVVVPAWGLGWGFARGPPREHPWEEGGAWSVEREGRCAREGCVRLGRRAGESVGQADWAEQRRKHRKHRKNIESIESQAESRLGKPTGCASAESIESIEKA